MKKKLRFYRIAAVVALVLCEFRLLQHDWILAAADLIAAATFLFLYIRLMDREAQRESESPKQGD